MTEIVAIEARAETEAELDEAMDAWWRALLAHAGSVSEADRLVADAWGETGRLIGHVQRANEPIGTDRGVRVVLTVAPLAASVQSAGFTSSALHATRETLFRAFERSRKRLAGDGGFASLWEGRAGCLYCEDGSLIAEPSLAPPPPKKKPAKSEAAKKEAAKTKAAKQPAAKRPAAKTAR